MVIFSINFNFQVLSVYISDIRGKKSFDLWFPMFMEMTNSKQEQERDLRSKSYQDDKFQ